MMSNPEDVITYARLKCGFTKNGLKKGDIVKTKSCDYMDDTVRVLTKSGRHYFHVSKHDITILTPLEVLAVHESIS